MAAASLGLTKVNIGISGSLKRLFCHFWDFDFSNLRMTFAKKTT